MYNLNKESKNAGKPSLPAAGKRGTNMKRNIQKIQKGLAVFLTAAMLLPVCPVWAEPTGDENVNPVAEEVLIDKEHFPDDRFREHVKAFDEDSNGKLSAGELAEVTEMDVCAENIESLQGIEYFTDLEDLYCAQNRLKTLDVSKNTKLNRLSCMKNNLAELDLKNNRELTNLYCVGNQLKALDLSENTQLTDLSCNDNNLTELDLTGHSELEILSCKGNSLKNLNLKGCTGLKRVLCDDNRLTELNFEKNADLVWLSCRNNRLENLSIENCADLVSLACGGNQLTGLNTQKNKELTYFSCENNRITDLNIGNNPNLVDFSCYGNRLTSLDVSANQKLKNLYCYKNNLTSLDLRSNKSLQNVRCHGNRYQIVGTGFDYSTLPGNFDISRVSNVQNGKFDEQTHMFSFGEGQAEASYIYEMDDTHREIFRIVRSTFSDVSKDAFYHDAAIWALDQGIANGVGGTEFAPEEICTRGQVVTFLWRAAQSPDPTITESPFTDVQNPEDFYYKAVLWASEKGIASGVGENLFDPGGECTRGQVVTFLWRTKEEPAPQNSVSPFRDIQDPAAFYYTPVLWAAEQKITDGTEEGFFDANGICTRGQIVTFLYRCMK